MKLMLVFCFMATSVPWLSIGVDRTWTEEDLLEVFRAPFGFGTVTKTTYDSSSCRYSLTIDPGYSNGYQGASYEYSVAGNRVWAGERPYTLREVSVTEDGLIVGFAYYEPVFVRGETEQKESLHIVILDRDGKELLNDKQERCPGLNFCHSPELPYVQQMIVDSENDRLIIRAVEWDPISVVREDYFWWCFRLSTGEKLGRFNTRERMADSNTSWWLIDVKPLPGTPFYLCHWWTKSKDYDVADAGARFTLVNANAKPVWTYDANADYGDFSILGKYCEASFFERNPAILQVSQKGLFVLRFFKTGERVQFSVESASGDGCKVTEVSRTPFSTDKP